MRTIRDLGERGIVLRSLREGIDTSNAAGRMVAGVLASLAKLELARQPEMHAGHADSPSVARRHWTSQIALASADARQR
jgi:hypothetical protein